MKSKKPIFLQIIIQEKSAADGDWRSFCICLDSQGDRWELRGYGETPAEATTCAYDRFLLNEDEWEIYGHMVPFPEDPQV
jgi:hypothetical protein